MKRFISRGIASVIIFFSICFFIGCSSDSSDESQDRYFYGDISLKENYDAASLSGAWILESDASPIRHYLITDGTGKLTGWSMADSGAGEYHINPNGFFIFTAGGSDTKGRLSLSSSDKGTIHFNCCGDWRMSKINDLSACQGDWQGVISEADSSQAFRVIISVDSEGSITSVQELDEQATGRMVGLPDKISALIEYGNNGQTLILKADRRGDTITGEAFFDESGASPGVVSLTKVEYNHENAASLLIQYHGARKGLIINADDLGMGGFANEGIFSAWDAGAITSISLFTVTMAVGIDGQPVPGDPFAEAVDGIKMRPGIDVGCHLTLASTDGFRIRPVLPPEQVPTLVDNEGYLKESYVSFLFASRDEIRAEARAQIEKALASGVNLSHLDCHVGWGHITSGIKDIYTELGDEYRLPLRWVVGFDDEQRLIDHRVLVPKKFVSLSDSQIEALTPDAIENRKQFILKTLGNLPDGITEILCHPGTGAPEGQVWRTVDYMVLTDPEVRAQIESMISSGELVMLGFNDLKRTMKRL